MRDGRSIVFLLCLTLTACNRASSPLARLQQDSPVKSQEVVVERVDVNQQVNVEPLSTCVVTRGKSIHLSGTMIAASWGLSGITATWQPRQGEPSAVTSPSKQADDRTLLLLAFIHGDDLKKDLGIVATQMVEARQSADRAGTVEFRAQLTAPSRSGYYVMDLQLIDTSETRQRGVKPTKASGFPVWRCQLDVK